MTFSSRESFLKFFSQSPAGLTISEADTGKIIEVNHSFCDMVGYDKNDLVGKTSVELGILGSEQRQILSAIIRKDGRLLNLEVPIRSRKSEIIWILMSVDIIEISGKRYNLATSVDITKVKKDHEALVASETKYQSVFENSLAGIIISDIHSLKVLDANIVAAEMLGYQNREDIITNYDATRHYINMSDRSRLLDRLLKDDQVSDSVLALKKCDGTPVYIKIFARDVLGTSTRVTVMIDATTEVVQFRELEKSRKHYRLMFENMREAYVVMEPVTDEFGNFIDARFLEINPAGEKAIGKAREELIGRRRSEALGNFDEKQINHFNLLLHSGETMAGEVYFEHSGKWMEGRTYVQNGLMISIAFDITKRKLAEQQLELERGWTQLLNDAVYRLWNIPTMKEGLEEILSTSLKLMNVNRGYIQLFDAKRHSLVIGAHRALSVPFLVHFAKATPDLGSESTGTSGSRSQFVANDTPDDPIFLMHGEIFRRDNIHSMQSTPFFNHEGFPIGMVLTHASDIHHFSREALRRMELYARYAESFLERVRIHDELSELNHQLENKVKERTSELSDALNEANKLSEIKSRFVSTASHEFRTPLSTILSSAFLAGRFVKTEEQGKREKHLRRIQSSVKALTEILNDFLSLEKLEQGKVLVEKTSFNLNHLLKDMVEELSTICKEGQSIKLVYTGNELIFQDERIVRNIVLNLLSNAIKYSNTEIDLLVERTREQVTLVVKDVGIGIPTADQDKIFGKFFRASNAINIQGTGLGLNILHHYVELLGGKIRFTSKENEGTTFIVELPS